MGKRGKPQKDWEEIVVNICLKSIFPVFALWLIVACIAIMINLAP